MSSSLHHIAVRTDHLNKTIDFYSRILGLVSTGEFCSKESSALIRYGHSLLSHAPRSLHQITRDRFASEYQMTNARLCQMGTGSLYYEMLIVEEEDPKTGKIKPVSGISLFGLSFILREEIDPDILAWDLEIAGVPFRIGDSYSSGLRFTQEHESHSVFLTDPDGRIIELIPSGSGRGAVTSEPLKEAETGILLVSALSHLMIYVSDISKSSRFYQEKLGFIDVTSRFEGGKTADNPVVYLGDEKNSVRLILMQKLDEQGLCLPAGGNGIDHLGLLGSTIKSSEMLKKPSCIIISQEKEKEQNEKEPASQKMRSCQYLSDPDGYVIEICDIHDN